jgi:hypothetical protein
MCLPWQFWALAAPAHLALALALASAWALARHALFSTQRELSSPSFGAVGERDRLGRPSQPVQPGKVGRMDSVAMGAALLLPLPAWPIG